jgi:hypothetical protein
MSIDIEEFEGCLVHPVAYYVTRLTKPDEITVDDGIWLSKRLS